MHLACLSHCAAIMTCSIASNRVACVQHHFCLTSHLYAPGGALLQLCTPRLVLCAREGACLPLSCSVQHPAAAAAVVVQVLRPEGGVLRVNAFYADGQQGCLISKVDASLASGEGAGGRGGEGLAWCSGQQPNSTANSTAINKC
jgi:hypothetical protein